MVGTMVRRRQPRSTGFGGVIVGTLVRRPQPRGTGPVSAIVASRETEVPVGGPELSGRSFVSTAVRGRELVAGTTVRLTFGDDHVSARAGCNTVFGGATWSDGTLRAGQLAMTMMACSPELEEQDGWLSDLLTSSPALVLDGGTLTVGGPDSGLTLEEESRP